jgi:hypothetical protein
MRRAGPVAELIAKTRDWRGATLATLGKIVHDADPEIAEDVKGKRPSNPLGSAVWSHDGQVCVGIILKERVRLACGRNVRDLGPLIEWAQATGTDERCATASAA